VHARLQSRGLQDIFYSSHVVITWQSAVFLSTWDLEPFCMIYTKAALFHTWPFSYYPCRGVIWRGWRWSIPEGPWQLQSWAQCSSHFWIQQEVDFRWGMSNCNSFFKLSLAITLNVQTQAKDFVGNMMCQWMRACSWTLVINFNIMYYVYVYNI